MHQTFRWVASRLVKLSPRLVGEVSESELEELMNRVGSVKVKSGGDALASPNQNPFVMVCARSPQSEPLRICKMGRIGLSSINVAQ